MKEKWKVIEGWTSYMISSRGRVKRIKQLWRRKPGGFLSASKDGRGYYGLWLTRTEPRKEHRHFKIHRLMALNFIGNQPGKLTVNHKNGIKGDNRLENLEYLTNHENIRHASRLGLLPLGEKRWNAKLNPFKVRQIRMWLQLGYNMASVARAYSIHWKTLMHLRDKKTWYWVTD